MEVKRKGKINEYIDAICSEIKFHEAHDEIRMELENHITELAQEYVDSGLSDDEAVNKSVAQMGDAEVVGKQLNKVHKPKPEWSILLMTIILSGIGTLVNYFIQTNESGNSQAYPFLNWVLSFSGIFIIAGLYFFNYRKIKFVSKYMFLASNLLLLYILLYFNNLHFGAIERGVVFGLPFLLILSAAGILDGWNWERPSNMFKAALMLVIPVFLLMMCPSFSAALIYSAAFLTISIISGLKIRYAVLTIFSGISMFLYILTSGPLYRLNRFIIFFNPNRDPNGAGYIYKLIHDTLGMAKLFSSPGAFNPLQIPSRNTDFVFTYIICAFGWAAGIFIAIMFAVYIIRIIHTAALVKDSYGRLLISGFATIFILRFFWNIPMALGITPITGVSLPFISYGRIDYIVNITAIGLILSVYRRKNLSVFEVNR